MNYTERCVNAFKEIGKNLLDTQVAELRNIENSLMISGKLARFKIFNNHLDILQQQLTEEINLMLNNANVVDTVQRDELEIMLRAISAEYINEYMCISFLKNEP